MNTNSPEVHDSGLGVNLPLDNWKHISASVAVVLDAIAERIDEAKEIA